MTSVERLSPEHRQVVATRMAHESWPFIREALLLLGHAEAVRDLAAIVAGQRIVWGDRSKP